MKKNIILTIALLTLASVSGVAASDREWTIFLVQQTHTDIGYTRPQSEILSEHLRYIDYAIDFSEITADYPDECRFRWTCEAAWAVTEYIKVRPQEQVKRLLDCIKRGQIEVTGMYFNMAEVADESSLRYFFHPLHEARESGVPIKLAMQNDVNGAAWCMTDYLPDLGIKYFWIGSNKTKSLLPFEIPTIFKWLSPSGQTLVAYRSEHYMVANMWGIEKDDVARFERGSSDFLEKLSANGYPYDAVGVQHLGYFVDNAPPSYNACEFVRKWNETHDNPKLRTATASQFLDYICNKYGTDDMPVHQVAWPDWWTDGFGSAAKETGEGRKGQADMIGVTGLLAMGRAAGAELPEYAIDEIETVYNNFLFYDEHTFGASESVSDPACWNSQIQFDNKASYSWTGLRKAKMLFETAAGLLQGRIPAMKDASLTLFNPLAWRRDATATIFVDYDILPKGKNCSLEADNGQTALMQEIKAAPEGRYFKVFARDIPSLGYRTYRMVLSDKRAAEDAPSYEDAVIENEWYKLKIDAARGGITSLIDKKAGGRELVDKSSEWALGSFIYETMETRDVLLRFESRGFSRFPLTGVSVSEGTDGPLFKSLIVNGFSDAADEKGVKCEVMLYKQEPRIGIRYTLRRKADFKENSIYVAFPFTTDNPQLAMDVQGGVMQPGKNQLEGSSTEWYTMQNYVAARSEDHQIFLSSPEIPLVMLGNLMLDAPFHYTKTYDSPTVYSWAMNNYWFTNFKASQQDEFSWEYNLRSAQCGSNPDAAALRTALSDRVELYGRVIPGRKESAGPELTEWSGISMNAAPEIIITGAAPAAFHKGIILQIRNLGSSEDSFTLTGPDGKAMKFRQVNALEEKMGRPCTAMSVKGGADIFVLVP